MTTIAAVRTTALMLTVALGRFLVVGVIRYGWAVAMCPGSGRQEDIDEFIEQMSVKAEANFGVRAIESFLRQQA
jgi:hypothetical protein